MLRYFMKVPEASCYPQALFSQLCGATSYWRRGREGQEWDPDYSSWGPSTYSGTGTEMSPKEIHPSKACFAGSIGIKPRRCSMNRNLVRKAISGVFDIPDHTNLFCQITYSLLPKDKTICSSTAVSKTLQMESQGNEWKSSLFIHGMSMHMRERKRRTELD